LRRAALVVVGVVLAIAGIAAVALLVSSRDDSQVAGTAQGPGRVQPEGADPPASGPHRNELVTRDRQEITDDQLVQALQLGNVVILYAGARPAPALVRLQKDVAGPFDAELAAAGQAVILARRAGAGPATALAWQRILRADDPSDRALRQFAEFWLGRGIP
jgi:Protein of unknown function (DUF3105)